MDTLPEPLRPKFGSKLESSVNIGGLEINSDSLTRISEITGENAVGRLQEAIKKPLLVAENKSGGQVVFVDLSGKTGLKNGSQKGKLNLAETGKIAALRISSNSGKSVISGVTFKPQILSLEGFITDNAKSFVPTYFDNGINSLLSNSLKLDIENALKAKKTIESQTEERQGFEEGISGDEGTSSTVGKLTGSLDGLTSAERKVVNDLLSQGKNVEIIPRSNVQGVSTPDFIINGVKTELKTLNGTSLNTPVTRITDAFKQGADAVIIDARNVGITAEQANQILNRAAGTYQNKVLPGQVEIWTVDGIIRR